MGTQLRVGDEFSSGFCDAFEKILGNSPVRSDGKALFATWIDTPLGPMLAIVDEEFLYLLEFIDRRGLAREIDRLRKSLKIGILLGRTPITDQIEKELADYFNRTSSVFRTPFFLLGSPFQKTVWKALQSIPVGETYSYLDIAKAIGNIKAFRAVGNANGVNQLAIIIPCHRVINENGELGGYGGGLSRKQWLIAHEKGYSNEKLKAPNDEIVRLYEDLSG